MRKNKSRVNKLVAGVKVRSSPVFCWEKPLQSALRPLCCFKGFTHICHLYIFSIFIASSAITFSLAQLLTLAYFYILLLTLLPSFSSIISVIFLPSPHIIFLSQSVLNAGSSGSEENELSLCGSRICHEIAHSWFGLVIGAKDWTEEWISEGFATYLEDIIWAEVRQVHSLLVAPRRKPILTVFESSTFNFIDIT